jgi:purine-binding chemotaxis protein CheW
MKKQRPCVLFALCNESFGMDVENVLRVINLEKIMKVPKAPAFIVGAISLDGNVIPVVDLARKIELGETAINESTKVLVVEIFHDDATLLAGVLIDDVLDVVTIDDSKLLPPVLESMGFDADSIHGMYKLEDTFYNILNPSKIFEKEFASLV